MSEIFEWRFAGRGITALAALAAGLAQTRADSVFLAPVADTTLIETVPDNNMGAQLYVNAGTTQNYTRNRGLFKFDLAGQVPPGSRVTSVTVTFEVVHEPKDGYASASFDLHRVLRAWGEGDQVSADPHSPGLGAPATAGEATWNHRFALTTNTWAAPGAAATNDYVAVPSAEQAIYDLSNSPYTFGPEAGLTADAQLWLDHPETNFGWLLKCADETFNFTARRFGSREDPDNAPILEVDYDPPLRITQAGISGGKLTLQFTALPGQSYAVEFSDTLRTGSWSTLTNLTGSAAGTNVVVVAPTGGAPKFFRLRTP